MKKLSRLETDPSVIDVLPEPGDKIELIVGRTARALSVHWRDGTATGTDKVNYPSMGGVALVGGSAGCTYLITDPGWAAAISKAAVTRYPNADDTEPPTVSIRRMETASAVKYLTRMLGEYPVPGYVYGPDAWEPYNEKKP